MFLSGAIIVLLTISRVRALVIDAIPRPMKHATAAGIGLFIAFLGFRNAGVIAPSQATLVTIGPVASTGTLLSLAGLVVMGALSARSAV